VSTIRGHTRHAIDRRCAPRPSHQVLTFRHTSCSSCPYNVASFCVIHDVGIRVCQRFVATPAMQSIGAVHPDPPTKFCKQHDYDSDAYWECVIRRNMLTIYHPCGTARMGDVKHSSTVVDPRLRSVRVTQSLTWSTVFVHEIQGLLLVTHISMGHNRSLILVWATV
jgi:hypothetical protein